MLNLKATINIWYCEKCNKLFYTAQNTMPKICCYCKKKPCTFYGKALVVFNESRPEVKVEV